MQAHLPQVPRHLIKTSHLSRLRVSKTTKVMCPEPKTQAILHPLFQSNSWHTGIDAFRTNSRHCAVDVLHTTSPAVAASPSPPHHLRCSPTPTVRVMRTSRHVPPPDNLCACGSTVDAAQNASQQHITTNSRACVGGPRLA
ncbi:hypothetical protein MRX96_048075 [Rhipicephalus microplus]